MSSFSEPQAHFLRKDQIEHFNTNGYLVIENFWDNALVECLKNRITEIIATFDFKAEAAIFSTDEQSRNSNKYFLESGDKIRFFWEEKSWDANGNLVQPAMECINKIGHALHDLDPKFERVSYDKRVFAICKELGLEVIWVRSVLSSMCFTVCSTGSVCCTIDVYF